MLVFDIELLSFEKGVPPGYLFVWLDNTPENLFEAMDMDKNLEVPLQEVSVCGHCFKFPSLHVCLVGNIRKLQYLCIYPKYIIYSTKGI